MTVEHHSDRRSFLKTGALAGTALVASASGAIARRGDDTEIPEGDVAILRFLAAAEILETDLWQQYNELGGIPDDEVPGGTINVPFRDRLKKLDMDMDQYVHDNTEDEFSHQNFINAYLVSKGAQPVNLEPFRTLAGSQATGADKKKLRLTNLMKLKVDTSYWTRYRSRAFNPDLGDVFPPAIPDLLSKGPFPAIPRDDNDTKVTNNDDRHIQAIANTAAFHFASIEQGGSSLYPTLAQKVTNPEVLLILLSIGPTETMHFQTWQDKAGNAVQLTDPTNGLTFPDLNALGEDFQTNLIMPEPCPFLNRKKFPVCSVIRPTRNFGAVAAFTGLAASGLFFGQPKTFFDAGMALARAADAARRECDE